MGAGKFWKKADESNINVSNIYYTITSPKFGIRIFRRQKMGVGDITWSEGRLKEWDSVTREFIDCSVDEAYLKLISEKEAMLRML